MNKLSEDIMLLSFLEELEKDAAFDTLVRVLKNTDLVAGYKGIKAGLKVLGRHRSPMFALPKGALNKTVNVIEHGKNVKGVERFVLNELGNTAHALSRVSEGVGKGKSLVTNVKTVGKNFGKLIGDQVRGSQYHIIPKETAVFPIAGKGKTLQGKGLFSKSNRFDREILGKTNKGNYIVKKRKATRPFSLALTPVGFGASTLALGSGKKDESPVSRTGAAIKETAMWSLVPPVAQAKLISDMLK